MQTSCVWATLDSGGLFKLTTSVVKVCIEAEKAITKMLITTNGKLPQGKGIPDAIALSVLWALGTSQIFQELKCSTLHWIPTGWGISYLCIDKGNCEVLLQNKVSSAC